MSARARLTIDLAALVANWRLLADLAEPARAGAAIKADAYGLGMGPVADALVAEGCRDLFVATPQEAEMLRVAQPGARIHLLGGLMPADVDLCLARDIQPVLSTPDQLLLWRLRGQGEPCDIMVDTGMHRLGIDCAQIAAEQVEGLAVDVLMSHLACADAPDHPLNALQLKRFSAVAARIPAARRSLANSAGVLLGPDYAFDLVRPGIGVYGGNPRPGLDNPFAPVIVVEAQVVQLALLEPGESIGYGATWKASRPSRIATLSLGYGDGYGTGFSGKGMVALAGALCPVVGRVSMDLTTVDATAAPAVQIGDWALVLGGPLPLDHSAALAGINQYEVLTGLGGRFARRYEGSR